MEPLITLLVVTAGLRVAGALGVRTLRRTPTALRGGLAAMFVLTGGAHMIGLRDELIAMVPPGLPHPELLVTLTGIAELAGAVGLLWSRTATLAAGCLAVLMLAMFPANVYAATSGLATSWSDQLLPRTLIQVVFVTAAGVVVLDGWRRRGAKGNPSGAAAALQPDAQLTR